MAAAISGAAGRWSRPLVPHRTRMESRGSTAAAARAVVSKYTARSSRLMCSRPGRGGGQPGARKRGAALQRAGCAGAHACRQHALGLAPHGKQRALPALPLPRPLPAWQSARSAPDSGSTLASCCSSSASSRPSSSSSVSRCRCGAGGAATHAPPAVGRCRQGRGWRACEALLGVQGSMGNCGRDREPTNSPQPSANPA